MKSGLGQESFSDWNIKGSLIELARDVEKAVSGLEQNIAAVSRENSLKVLRAFREAGVREFHLHPSSGYGYHDSGREALDCVFARAFGAEEAVVRPQFVSGTHALSRALFGLLRPGDEAWVIPESCYDTLLPVFGFRESSGSLAEWGVSSKRVSAEDVLSGKIKPSKITKLVLIQRSKGYDWRPSLSIGMMERIIRAIRSERENIQVVVDNCYGEFVEEREPCEAGADLVVGSLIKNPGGGLAATGAYVAGKKSAVAKTADALTAPGLGKEVGSNPRGYRDLLTGFYLSPMLVGEALKTAVFASELFNRLGYPVLPGPLDERTDIIQAIRLGSAEKVLAFARGIQSAGPLEHSAIPEAAPMAGYADRVVMAGGTFVQGGSLELSCDAPMREPYHVYLQGGLSSAHGKLGVLLAAREVENAK